MLSTRYSLLVAFALSLALIPTVIHNYLGLTTEDGRAVRHIAVRLGAFDSHPTQRNPNWGEITFGSNDWFERHYQDQHGRLVRLFAARAYDHKRLYHHPELALSYGGDFEDQGIVILKEASGLPVKLLRNRNGRGLVAYALHYDDQFIDHPIRHQLKESLELLISPRKPITLFYVSDNDTPKHVDFKDTPAARLLKSAVDDFLTQTSRLN
ncbi:MAG: hypothetical protein Kow0065_00920 [Methylomicrobium sp.]